MSNTLTGLWSAVNKPKSEEKRRPKKPEDPKWRHAKNIAVVSFAFSMSLMATLGLKQATDPGERQPSKIAATLFSAMVAKRAYKNMRDTFKAAQESGDYEYKSNLGIPQLPPPTTLNLSYRENCNVYMGTSTTLIAYAAMPQTLALMAPVVLGNYILRNSMTYPEGDKGHFRPKWLRDVMNGGDKGGPSGR